MRIFLCLIAIVASACASLQRFRTPAAPAAPPQRAVRPIPYPVFETRAFTRAVQAGTRTRTGEPGPNYWQQYAHYRIDAELVPATSQLNGRETVRYYNRSPDTLRTIWIHLKWSAYSRQQRMAGTALATTPCCTKPSSMMRTGRRIR